MHNHLQEAMKKLQDKVTEHQVEINRLRTTNHLLNREIDKKNETIHKLREEIFLLSAIKD